MNIIKPSYQIIDKINGEEILRKIENAARTCYKSEEKIGKIETTKNFIRGIIKSGHESTIEHISISVRIICDRGVSHEIVRHRIASYSQESTRYCNYGNENRGLNFIRPCFWHDDDNDKNCMHMHLWTKHMEETERIYNLMIENGAKPEEARSILPNSLKTELVMTANLRSWRNFFKLRTSNRAHPQIREIAIPLLKEFQQLIPVVFDDIQYEK